MVKLNFEKFVLGIVLFQFYLLSLKHLKKRNKNVRKHLEFYH